ncbi:CoA binding domain-containing protein [Trametes meyenii]|nr:CoA binding domain-containing protein [Trametes meyenii]
MAGLVDPQEKFLSSPKYGVVGASKVQTKYGTKVIKWYQVRSKDVTLIHSIQLEGLKMIDAVSELSALVETNFDHVPPPYLTVCVTQVTLGVLEQAKALGVPALWFQPGAEVEAVITYVKENGLEDKVIYGGPCILVEGDSGIIQSLLRALRRSWSE